MRSTTRKRLEVLSRADFRCERCGNAEQQLHAHHKTYVRGRQPWTTRMNCWSACATRATAWRTSIKRSWNWCWRSSHRRRCRPLTKLLDKVAAVLTATERVQRVNAMNALRDELDVVADFTRGPGGATT